MSKINEKEIELLATILSVKNPKEKKLKEECQETLEKYLKIRDILVELNVAPSAKVAKKEKQK